MLDCTALISKDVLFQSVTVLVGDGALDAVTRGGGMTQTFSGLFSAGFGFDPETSGTAG